MPEAARNAIYFAVAIGVAICCYKFGQHGLLQNIPPSEDQRRERERHQETYLLESIVASMLLHHKHHSASTIDRVILAYNNGLFREVGLEGQVRVWLNAVGKSRECSGRSRAAISNIIVGNSSAGMAMEDLEFEYAATGDAEKLKQLELLRVAAYPKIAAAAERVFRRQALAEDPSGRLLAMSGTLREEFTPVVG
jgi:hypothetical protein